MRLLSKIYFAIFFTSIIFDCAGQQYNFRNYNVPEGLAHSHVSKIFQDSKGYLWFSTLGGGVSKFDGKNFINFTEKEGLSSNLIRCAIQAKNGDYWFGTSDGGLSKFDGTKFERIVDSTSNISDMIFSLTEDEEGAIWFTTNEGIYKYFNKKFISVNKEFALPPKSANGLFMDSKNRIWFSIWDMGVYCIDNKKITNYTEKDGLTSPCYTVAEDKEGSIWLALKNGVVKSITENNKLHFVPFDNDYLNNGGMIYSILADNKGNMWFGTENSGLIKYSIQENKFVQISMKNGLPKSSITALIEDREGNIWMACLGYGAVKYSGAAFVHYNIKDGLLMNYAGTIVQDKNKDLLINSAYSISRLKQNDTIVPFEENWGGKIHTIYNSKKGVLWVAAENGLFSFEDGKKKQYTKKDGLNAFPPTTLTEDKNGNIWCSSVYGWVSYFDGKQFVNFDKENGLKGDYIYSIYADSKDNIWVGNWATGLCKLEAKGNKFNYFTKKEGLPSNNIMTVTEDEKGDLWIGTFGGGISIYDGKNFKTISTRDGLSDDVILGLIFDKYKDLWASATKGINRLDMKEYNSSGKTKFRVYGKAEGFSNIECILNATLKDSENNLWFGTKGGLTKYNAAEDQIQCCRRPYQPLGNANLYYRY